MFSLKNTRYMQYVAALSATLSVSANTMYVTWASPAIPKLTSINSPIGVTLTREEASWMASIFLLACVPICPIVPYLVDKFGRKRILLASAAGSFFPWIMLIFAKAVWIVFLARIIAGTSLGFVTASVSMYNGEIADNDIRGKLGTSFNIMKLFGSFLVLCVGPFVSYTELNIICACVPIAFFCIFFFMPESPYFLMSVGKKAEAKESLIKFSPKNIDPILLDKRLAEIQSTIDIDLKNKMGLIEFLTRKEYRKLIFILGGVKMLQQMSGALAMDSYLQTIIESSGSSISSEDSSIIFGAIQFPAALLTAAIVDKWGRRPILITSAFGCSVSLISEGVYFYLQDFTDHNMEYLAWLPTTALVLFLIISSFGINGLPYILMGELFPTNIKSAAATVATAYGAILGFVAIKLFDPISEAWGRCTIFWIFGGVCAAGMMFVYFFLPETKGKTFMEIQNILNGNKIDHEQKEKA